MRKLWHILRVIPVWILAVFVISQGVIASEAPKPGHTIDPGEILLDLWRRAKETVDSVTIPDFEGEVRVAAADGMRDAIAEHFRSEDDMSWIQHADVRLQGTFNETNGADLEATLLFNDTELYHLQASYDRAQNIIYLVCPELKKTVLAFPIGDFTADAQTITGRKVTPEMIAEYTTVLTELNDLVRTISLETLRGEVDRYVGALGKYFHVENGFMTVLAGSLSREAHTVAISIKAEDLKEMIPEALRMLSEDPFLQEILRSPFAEHVFRLTVGKKAYGLLPEGTLWQIVQNALVQASNKDYTKLKEVAATIAFDRSQIPIHLSVSMEQSGMKAELLQVSAIMDGSDHAMELSLGPVLAKKAGLGATMSSGLLLQGNLKDAILRETLSLKVNGEMIPLLRIQDFDLLEIRDAWLKGTVTLIWKGHEYSCRFFRDENGMRTMTYSVNGEEWFTLTADIRKVENTSLDEMDLSDAFTVDSRKAFFKYMRDASAIRMFEKLSSAGVPQEYVDMLTDGEAATESSRENTVER